MLADSSVSTQVSSLSEFRDLINTVAVLPLELDGTSGGFRARVRHTDAGGIGLGRISGQAHSAHYSGRPPRGDVTRRLVFNVQLRGKGSLWQGERSTPIGPKDIAVYDTTRPFTMTFDTPYQRLAIIVPYSMLARHMAFADATSAVRLPSTDSVTSALGAALDPLERAIAMANASTRARLMHVVTDTVGALSGQVADHYAAGRGAAYDGLRAALDYIDEHLGDPDLSPTMIAADTFMSVRRLYRLFEDHGIGVAATIRMRRLEQCRRDLDDDRFAHRSLSAVAAANGFTSASYFSTLFRETYHLTPSQYRNRDRGVGPVAE